MQVMKMTWMKKTAEMTICRDSHCVNRYPDFFPLFYYSNKTLVIFLIEPIIHYEGSEKGKTKVILVLELLPSIFNI